MAAGAAEVCRLEVVAKHTSRDSKTDLSNAVLGSLMLCFRDGVHGRVKTDNYM